jgi:hypothetical protein
MEQIFPCVRCGSLVLWRDPSNAIRCSICEPARAAWLIRERLRATTTDTQLCKGMRLILRELNGAERIDARAVIDAAERAKIAPATLTRAREQLGLRSRKAPQGWVWVRRPH